MKHFIFLNHSNLIPIAIIWYESLYWINTNLDLSNNNWVNGYRMSVSQMTTDIFHLWLIRRFVYRVTCVSHWRFKQSTIKFHCGSSHLKTRNVCITKYACLYKIIFIVMVTLTFDLLTPKSIGFFPCHRGIMWPNLVKIGYTELKLLCGNLCGRPPYPIT